ncbi:MAG: AbrB/MazE/SpoVT family DNA-binding domain-containing protein [Acidobacteria bacterium]|nr:AbrB/MazE/SpoVT family DNA-binding domain-containing protein [Acidobacteriota bacterium]
MKGKTRSDQVVVSTKGQIVIPARLRQRFHIRKGTRLAVFEEDGRLVVQPMSDFIRGLRGAVKKGRYTLREFLRQRKQDRYA